MANSNQDSCSLRDAIWIFGNPQSPVLAWAGEWIQKLVPKLTGSPAVPGCEAGNALNIAVGSPDENLLVSEAVSQGLIDFGKLKEDDFVLKQVRMNDNVIRKIIYILQLTSPKPCL